MKSCQILHFAFSSGISIQGSQSHGTEVPESEKVGLQTGAEALVNRKFHFYSFIFQFL